MDSLSFQNIHIVFPRFFQHFIVPRLSLLAMPSLPQPEEANIKKLFSTDFKANRFLFPSFL